MNGNTGGFGAKKTHLFAFQRIGLIPTLTALKSDSDSLGKRDKITALMQTSDGPRTESHGHQYSLLSEVPLQRKTLPFEAMWTGALLRANAWLCIKERFIKFNRAEYYYIKHTVP